MQNDSDAVIISLYCDQFRAAVSIGNWEKDLNSVRTVVDAAVSLVDSMDLYSSAPLREVTVTLRSI